MPVKPITKTTVSVYCTHICPPWIKSNCMRERLSNWLTGWLADWLVVSLCLFMFIVMHFQSIHFGETIFILLIFISKKYKKATFCCVFSSKSNVFKTQFGFVLFRVSLLLLMLPMLLSFGGGGDGSKKVKYLYVWQNWNNTPTAAATKRIILRINIFSYRLINKPIWERCSNVCTRSQIVRHVFKIRQRSTYNKKKSNRLICDPWETTNCNGHLNAMSRLLLVD